MLVNRLISEPPELMRVLPQSLALAPEYGLDQVGTRELDREEV